MFPFRKSQDKASSRKQINIKEVKDDVLVLPNNRYRMIVETSSINFELKSEEEQDIIIEGFQNFLNSLSCKLQIMIRIREIDVDSYLADITEKANHEGEAVYKKQMKNYAEFIQNLIAGNKILSRRFYIIIPYDAKEKTDFSIVKQQLLLNQDIVTKGLEKLGMKARSLNSLELLDIFYHFYNPKRARQQPLTKSTMKNVLHAPYETTTSTHH